MSEKKTMIEASRTHYYTNASVCFDDLKVGCLQRIANALEAIRTEINAAQFKPTRDQRYINELERKLKAERSKVRKLRKVSK